MKEIITRGCYRWGLCPTPEALGRMESFADMLVEKNRVMNLTAITEPQEIGRRHFLDCLFMLTCADFAGKHIIDVGCGAGFPTVPLLCYDPTLDITALDSTAKRVEFVAESCAALGLPVAAECGRAEEYAAHPGVRESFDIATSRAVAPLAILAELCLPFVKVGGLFMPLKSAGETGDRELYDAAGAIEKLGAKLEAVIPYDIPGLDSRHQVLVIEKLRPTPEKYPRRYSRIKEKPLK